jgi:hypothetical protein
VSFERKLTRAELRQRALSNWGLWRLVLSERGFDFATVFGRPYMTPLDVDEANVALDMQIEAERREAKRKR